MVQGGRRSRRNASSHDLANIQAEKRASVSGDKGQIHRRQVHLSGNRPERSGTQILRRSQRQNEDQTARSGTQKEIQDRNTYLGEQIAKVEEIMPITMIGLGIIGDIWARN